MRTGSVDRIEDTGGVATERDPLDEGFTRRVADFAEAARRVRTGVDPEAIHDLRVAARRLTSALGMWQDLIPTRVRRAARRRLRRIRRRLGRARELEVHVALLEDRLPGAGAPGGPAAADLLEQLRERLARRRRSAARRLGPGRLKRALRRLEAAGDGLGAPRPGAPDTPPSALDVERRLSERAAAALRSACERPDDLSLHEARVRVKKWRYALECLEDLAPGTTRPRIRPLRRIQDELGVAHDRALLRDLLERHARRTAPDDDGLGRLVEGLERERERAVRRFQRLAASFLGRDRHDRAHEARPAPPRAVAPHPGDAPRAGEPAPPDAPGGGAPRRGTGVPAGGQAAPRDERWDRMATWLTRTGRRG